MNKQLISISLFSVSGLVTASIANGFTQHKLPLPKPRVAHVVNLPRFTGIDASGNIQIKLRPGATRFQMIRNPQQQYVTAKVRNRILYLREVNLPDKKPQRVTVIVNMNRLNTLDTIGQVSINGRSIRASHLAIQACGNSYITLTGTMEVDSIKACGNSHVNLRWVNSNHLLVQEKNAAQVKLAGVAKNLSARLSGRSQLSALYLRSQDVWLQTKNVASATTLPVNSLRAFSAGNSNIYFYKMPKYLTRYSTDLGNVLQMDWRT